MMKRCAVTMRAPKPGHSDAPDQALEARAIRGIGMPRLGGWGRGWSRSDCGGIILVAVLITVAFISLVAVSLLFRMQAESAAASAANKTDQAHAAAMSGLQTTITLMMSATIAAEEAAAADASTSTEQAASARHFIVPDRELWWDNPDFFRNQHVLNDGANDWYFTVYARSLTDKDSVRYGLIDECGKVNINTATPEMLALMPGMTFELVDALMDWRDTDSETRGGGAEQDYYDQLPVPYLVKNGGIATIEELLLIKGFNGTVLYGEDANMNGLLEPNEDDGDESFPPDDNDGLLNPGLVDIAGAVSYGPDADALGSPRLTMTGNIDAGAMRDAGIPQETIDFLQIVRADGVIVAHPSQLLDMQHRVRRDQNRPRRIRAGTTVRSGIGVNELPIVMDKLTSSPRPERTPLFGLINVNTASAQALSALPPVDESLAEAIVEARVNLAPEQLESTAWLVTQGLIDPGTYQSIAPYLTARGYQYRVRVIGYGYPCGQYCTLEAVIDFADGTPRIAYLRDLTRLGPPFALDPEATEQ